MEDTRLSVLLGIIQLAAPHRPSQSRPVESIRVPSARFVSARRPRHFDCICAYSCTETAMSAAGSSRHLCLLSGGLCAKERDRVCLSRDAEEHARFGLVD